MASKLSPHQLNMLRQWEPSLRNAVISGNRNLAEDQMKKIQGLFTADRDHFRVLQAKNWYYECLIQEGKASDAKAGLEAVRIRANAGTRVYIEASALLAICYLRLQLIDEAKKMLRLVVLNINSISSVSRRRQFQKRLMDRIEDEIILSQMVGRIEGVLDPNIIHSEAVRLLREKSEGELYEMIGGVIPSATPFLLQDVKQFALGLMPPADQKLLPSPKDSIPKHVLGRKAAAALKRIGWRTFCDPGSEIYKTWKHRLPKAFEKGVFAAAITATLGQWNILIPQLAIGLAAVVMKFSCEEFCVSFKPEGLMIPRAEKA